MNAFLCGVVIGYALSVLVRGLKDTRRAFALMREEDGDVT